jgi:hypothetical protein
MVLVWQLDFLPCKVRCVLFSMRAVLTITFIETAGLVRQILRCFNRITDFLLFKMTSHYFQSTARLSRIPSSIDLILSFYSDTRDRSTRSYRGMLHLHALSLHPHHKFRKSLRMSGRAKIDHSVGQITTMISTDASRLDNFSAFGHK